MSPPQLSIIIVSWNVRDLLRKCLASLVPGAAAAEIIVIDSASNDGTAAMVSAEFPQISLIASRDNLGYSRGNNLGLRQARGRYLLLLNPDTEMAGDALGTMCAYLDEHPSVGVVAPQLLNPDGSVQPSRRRFPRLATTFFESTWLQAWSPPGVLEHYYAHDLAADRAVEIDWAVGAALMVRRAVVEQVGGLDESFFMYSEELDWCRRIRSAGWQVVYLPSARIVHHEGRSSAQVPAATHIRFNASKVRYVQKYHGRLAAALLRWYLLAGFAAQLIVEWLKGRLGHKRALRAERVSAYWQVLRSGLKGG